MKISKESEELRWIFLREFTRHIMMASMKDIPVIPHIKKVRDDEVFVSPRTRFNNSIFQTFTKKEPNYKHVGPMPGMMDLGKLNMIISDPRVKEIDCYGPDREILVRIGNSTQKTRVSLNKEDIRKIIDDFSSKTNIPLVKGIFKAALGNLILTAFISDFVETKFTIQKRNPFEPLIA